MGNPRILLVVGGGIAAYKACELVRLLRRAGCEVACVLTEGGSQFVTPMALAALSGNPVFTSLWDLRNEAEIGHIQLSRQADLIVVCPATADLMAKMAAGIADDLATTLLLATDKPVLVVPAMNVKMWEHRATARNVRLLRERGLTVIEPDIGAMACGEFGPGRLPEPERVWLSIAGLLGLDPAAAGISHHATAAGLVEALEPEDDGAGAGLGGLLASMIPRSTTGRAPGWDDEDDPDPEGEPWPPDAEPYIGPDLPEPDFSRAGSLLATKGRATAAPPTDPEAINHEVNARQVAPQPFAGEEAAAPVRPLGQAGMAQARPGAIDAAAGRPDLVAALADRPLAGRHVLVTAGPTHEPIDPVRYIANRSSGLQGFAIAAAAALAGARVTLISGPVQLATPAGVERIDVETAEEMARAVRQGLPADVAVMVAAVADWRPRDFRPDKIKKRGSAPPALILVENPDILASLAASAQRPDLLIGFAAETENLIDNARKKRKSKGVDWIVANDVSGGPGQSAMGGADNEVHLVREGEVESWEPMNKLDVGLQLMIRVAEKLAGHG